MRLPEETLAEMRKGFAQQVPLGRFGMSEEVANTALFLASDAALYINGVELEVDRGLSLV